MRMINTHIMRIG